MILVGWKDSYLIFFLLTHQLKTAAKELRYHPNITIKKQIKQTFLQYSIKQIIIQKKIYIYGWGCKEKRLMRIFCSVSLYFVSGPFLVFHKSFSLLLVF